MITVSKADKQTAHMAASLLLDYPLPERTAHYASIRAAVAKLPAPVSTEFLTFLDAIDGYSQQQLEAHFTATFDLKRKCCPYLSYYSTGDTRKRGMALVRFIEAYRAAGWEVDADELPDYLPVVLEFSARSDSPIASDLLASHREGIEVLRVALASFDSPYAHVVAAVSASLPEIDDATRERYQLLINEGPPSELVGVNFLGALAPYSPTGNASGGARP